MSPEATISGAEVAALFDAECEDIIIREDRQTVVALLRREDRVDLAVPGNMENHALWHTLEVCARFFLRVDHAKNLLKLLIGRVLMVIQTKPEFYLSRGFENFNDFMSDRERGLPWITGISRAELFKAKAVATQLGPGMTLEDARDLGLTKLQLIAKVTDTGSTEQRQLMDAARTDTIPQLRERIVRNGLIAETGDLELDALTIICSKTQKRLFEEFFNDPQVIAYNDTPSWGMILEQAIAEVKEEWQIKATIIIDVEVRDR